MDALTAAASTYFDLFYSDEEKRDYTASRVNQSMADKGLDLRVGDTDAKAKYRALLEQAISDKDEVLLAWLLGFAGTFAAGVDAFVAGVDESTRAAQEALQNAIDEAYSNFQRALDRDRSALEGQAADLSKTISSITQAIDMLRSAAKDLYGTVDSAAQMLAAQGMVYIEQVLDGLTAGASLLDYTDLSDAITAARSGISNGAYASAFERDRDALVLAGQLTELGDLGDLQLSFEERQLKAINLQIDYLDALGKKADELVNGTALLIGTVDQYFAQLLDLLDPSRNSDGDAATDGASGGGGGATFGGGGGYIMASGGGDSQFAGYLPDGRIQYKDGSVSQYPVSETAAASLADGRDPFSSYPSHDGSGQVEWDAGQGLHVPKYAAGGMHQGGARIVGEFGPELEVTGPSRIWNAAQTQSMLGGGAGMAQELRALREEVALLREETSLQRGAAQETARNTAGLPQMVEQFDNVSEGGNTMRMEAV